MFIRLLAWLLVRANAQPPSGRREAFYRMKDALLRRYGHLVGTEWQHIRKVCYACGGDGEADDGGRCWKCSGTGDYVRKWVLLERWQLGPSVFHRPRYETSIPPRDPVAIVGYIHHPGYGADSTEALLWLALLFDRPLLRELYRYHHYMEWSWCRPLSVLYRAWWSLRQGRLWVRRHVVEPVEPRRCAHCGHHFIPALSSSWYRCRACMYVQSQQQAVDDLPF